MGVVVFQGRFGQNRAIIGVIIGIWIMNGAQEFKSGTKGHGKARYTLKDGLGDLCPEWKGRIRLKRHNFQGKSGFP